MPVVLLIPASHPQSDHASLLRRAGLAVELGTFESLDNAGEILTIQPALIAIELEPSRDAETFESARRLRQHPHLRNTPIVVYATWLSAEHIETAARSGLLWIQITPVEKLVAAVRGLLNATESAGYGHLTQPSGGS